MVLSRAGGGPLCLPSCHEPCGQPRPNLVRFQGLKTSVLRQQISVRCRDEILSRRKGHFTPRPCYQEVATLLPSTYDGGPDSASLASGITEIRLFWKGGAMGNYARGF